MEIKSFFLSLIFMMSVQAKQAPENTFKLDMSRMHEKTEKELIQDKISELRAKKKENFFIGNFTNLQLYYLQTKLKSKDKK